jgi:uncharacterized repeat protein (TIGR02543 family)
MHFKKYSILASFLILPLLSLTNSESISVQANVTGDPFNKDTHNVKMVMAETHLNESSYYVSEDGKLYGKNGLDYDTGRTTNTDLVFAASYVHRIHDYIGILEDERIQDIELNQNYRMMVTQSGKVIVAGFNGGGALGAGELLQVNKPLDITEAFGDLDGDKVISLTTTGSYTHALTEQGQVFSYGTSYIIGNNTSIIYTPQKTPVNITSFFVDYDRTVDKVIKVLPGLALTEAGSVYGWGTAFNSLLVPTIIFDTSLLNQDEQVIDLVATGTGALLLTNQGRLFARGTNTFYQLGLADTTVNYPTFTLIDPTLIPLTGGTGTINYITSGFLFTDDHQVIAWGTNKDGVAGTGVLDDRSIPFTNITTAANTPLQEGEYYVSAFKSGNPNNGTSSTLISNLGVVYGLGSRNTLGYVLDGTNLPLRTPTAINPPRVSFTVDSEDGFEVGSFTWPYGFRVLFSNIYTANILNTVRPGYTFGGLFFDEALTQSVTNNFNYIATVDTTLYPKWFLLTATVSYLSTLPLPMTHSNPAQITGNNLPYTLLPASASGYTFQGWFTNAQYTTEITEINGSNFAQFLTIYAKFTQGTTSSETTSGTTSLPPSSGNTGEPTPPGPNRVAPIILGTVAAATVGGGVYWFFIAKKSFAELLALFVSIGLAIKVFFTGLFKKKKDKDLDKK